MNSTLKKILKPIASLYLTVALLVMAMVLIYAGTTVQKTMDIQDVQKQFFHSWISWISLDPALRPFAPSGTTAIPGGFWFVGGYTLIALLLVNLLAAHSVRFKLSWKRSGIIAIHLGLIIMLVGELLTSFTSVESQMMIGQGQTIQYSQDIRHVELALIDPSSPDHDQVTVIDGAALKPGAEFKPADLPFSVRVENYYPNSNILGPMQQTPGAVQDATAGVNKPLKVLPAAKASGLEQEVDQASAFISVLADGRQLGTYLLSQISFAQPEVIPVNGKLYRMELRYRRYYKPYSITLMKFSHDHYAGTAIDSNFSSRVRLVDPSRHVDREVLIWMNHPLTYQGETFYQQSFLPGDQTSILQVTHNPGWLLPYIGLAMGLVGMLVHFTMHLVGFLHRRSVAVEASSRDKARLAVAESYVADPVSAYSLEPRSRLLPWVIGFGAAAVCATIIFGTALTAPPVEDGFDLGAFGTLPIFQDGRVMPLESMADNALTVLRGRASFLDSNKESHPAIRWLADTLAVMPAANDYKVVRIDHPDILSQFGLSPDEKYFSIADLREHFPTIQKQVDLADQTDEKKRDLYQKKVLELAQHMMLFVQLQRIGDLKIVPPDHENGQWLPLATADGKLTPGAENFVAILQAYHQGETREFNRLVAEQRAAVAKTLPNTTNRVEFETFFDRFAPFYRAIFLYSAIFLLAVFSWMGWRNIFWPAAIGMLVVTALLHTFGIGARVYLTERGPITNLYASAIYIGWAVVLLAIGLEFFFRNGLGAAIASLIGFMTLLIAHYLGNDGDTMKPVVAVLATNFWLWTHVPCVTAGYAATFLSGMMAVAYVLLGVSTTILSEPHRKALARMVYAITCFAIFFSFVGTILGGIWADYSWGRFWGWDPKENGAILIVLWNAIILHARWGGLVRERGMMLLAIGGNIVTAWSWFGTNLLGIGLHSYGFMDGAATTLVVWMLVNVGIIGLGLIPLSKWRGLAKYTERRPLHPASASA